MNKKRKIALYFIIGRLLKLSSIGTVMSVNLSLSPIDLKEPINWQQLLQMILLSKNQDILPSYQYINVLYKGVWTWSEWYDTLQQAIYLGLIPNNNKRVNLTKPLKPLYTKYLLKTFFGKQINLTWTDPITYDVADHIIQALNLSSSSSLWWSSNTTISVWDDNLKEIFEDAYYKIRTYYIDKDNLTDTQLIHGAIKWMAESTKDSYTTFFPPTEAQDFMESLQWEFFGIGAYLEMKEPWKVIIVSPIQDTPAAQAGIFPGDQIIQINNEKIDKSMTLQTIVSKIKWPENTSVQLTLLRDGQEIVKDIIRKKIVINPLKIQEVKSDTVMFTISTFQFWLDSLFSKAVQHAVDKWYTRYIIDLRNNPWWSLEDVEQMLNYFVPSGQPSVIVKSNMREEPYLSQGVATGLSLQNKNIVILINKWSASASEILTAVIREYGSQVIVLGETSFGKWSVQSIRDYADGSNIKITIAKWLTWRNKTSIDKIGVKPDKEVIDDPKTTQDEVLDYAKSL